MQNTIQLANVQDQFCALSKSNVSKSNKAPFAAHHCKRCLYLNTTFLVLYENHREQVIPRTLTLKKPNNLFLYHKNWIMMIIKKKVCLQISRLNSKYVLHRLKRAWWIQEFQQPEEKKLLSSPSAWRKTLHASYSRQQWDEQGALEVGVCLLHTSDVFDSFNYLQHSFNVLGLVGAQTSPSRCHFRFTFGSARFWKPAKQRSLFFVRWWWVFLKGIYMHSAQGGTCRIKIQAEQDPPINTQKY